MKLLLSFALLLSMSAFAQVEQKKDLGSPSNAVSRGSADNAGISNGPIGPNKEEAKKLKSRNESMGGAPNAGVGTGTGTGAGSTVGNKVKQGSTNE